MAAAIAAALLCAQPAAASAGHSTAALRRTQATRSTQDVVRAVCSAPSLGRARCLALKLVPRGAQARVGGAQLSTSAVAPRPAAPLPAAPSPTAGEFGLRPQDLHSAYLLPTSAANAQTIALVDAYNDPSAEADLASYSDEFGLPACTAANGCFKQVNQEGETGNPPFPKTVEELESALKGGKGAEAEEAIGWSVEISLDIETAHAVCQNCHIMLVEANSPTFANLEAAENAAARVGATEISNSWGGPECVVVGDCASSSAFNHPGIVITAAAGDEGYLDWLEESGPSFADFPASSPQVVAVGGTRLALGPDGEWAGETVWNDGGEREGVKEGVGATGGGCSAQFTAPAWQQAVADWSKVGCGDKRAVSDVSADADPYSGVAVYDSLEECLYREGKALRSSHWCTIGGTSLATPLIAATFALAGGADGVEHAAKTLYENAASVAGSLHDVTEGSNGECLKPFNEATGVSGCTAAEEGQTSCSSKAVCLARSGYDGPTGLGTPDGAGAFALHSKPTADTGVAS
ncbi:MAG TPA: S53 family peptidase, partial [Solirubrobacteraceae bacterium]|nr:S53 family peptidase [Solirubrobacteraceae bacterium]